MFAHKFDTRLIFSNFSIFSEIVHYHASQNTFKVNLWHCDNDAMTSNASDFTTIHWILINRFFSGFCLLLKSLKLYHGTSGREVFLDVFLFYSEVFCNFYHFCQTSSPKIRSWIFHAAFLSVFVFQATYRQDFTKLTLHARRAMATNADN